MKKVKEIQNKKINARLYPIYKMISWDLLFYYSIIYLFLVQAKGFTASQILLSEAFFTASCLILQIPLGLLVDRFGKKNSLVFANICLCVFILILLFVNSYTQLLIALLINSIGYVIKGICESNILYDSLPRGRKRGSLFSWIDGKGTARYYVVDSITSLIAGYAFVLSPYLPIILCLIGNIIATILSTRFRHTRISIEDDDDIRTGAKEYFRQLKDAAKFAITSKRMLCLLIFFGLFAGLNYNMTTFRSGILEQIQLPEQYFGLVLAVVQIASATCSGLQGIIHKKFRNKTLTIIGIPMTSFLILIGLFAIGNPTDFKTILIIVLFVILGGVKGTHNVLIYRYLNNFTNREIRPKLSTVRNIVYNLFTIAISLFGSWLLSITNASNSIVILGVIVTTIMILLLYYMKDKVGLKVDDYSDEDLKYSHVIR